MSFQDQLFKIGKKVISDTALALLGVDGAAGSSNDAPIKRKSKTLTEAQAEADEASRQAGKEGTYKSSGTGGQLRRPSALCIECGLSFLGHEAFHWTDAGPVHGWGKYGERNVCGMAKKQHGTAKSKFSTSSNKNYLHCLECKETIYVNQPYHFVEGGVIHGQGAREDLGTCLVAFRSQLTEALSEIAEGFYRGEITPEQMLGYMQETHEVETKMVERIERANKQHKSAPTSSKSDSPGSDSTVSRDPQEQMTEDLFDAMDALFAVMADNHDDDLTMDEFREARPEEYAQFHDIYEHFDGNLSIAEAHEMLQDQYMELEGNSYTYRPDPADPCRCGSGKAYEDCCEEVDELDSGFHAHSVDDSLDPDDVFAGRDFDGVDVESFDLQAKTEAVIDELDPTEEMRHAERDAHILDELD